MIDRSVGLDLWWECTSICCISGLYRSCHSKSGSKSQSRSESEGEVKLEVKVRVRLLE